MSLHHYKAVPLKVTNMWYQTLLHNSSQSTEVRDIASQLKPCIGSFQQTKQQ